MQRRQYLSLAVLSLAGCISDEGNTSTTPTKTEAQTTNPTQTQGSESTPEQTVKIEYTITAGKSPEAIPESIRAPVEDGGRLEPGNQWVVVEFDVLEGTLDMQEIWFRSRIETETRFYDLDHATDKLADGVQSRGGIKAGGRGIALYQIPEDVTAYEWNLDETHARIEAIKK